MLKAVRAMNSASVVFVLCQLAVAILFEVSWLSETDPVARWTLLRHNSTVLLVVAQGLAVAAGVWLGIAWPTRRRRLFVCAAVPVALVAWYMVQSWCSVGAPGWWRVLVAVPAIGGTALLFAPSWAGVALGGLLGRRTRRSQSTRG